ncbi:acyl-CoA dehydrogenase [Halosimplex pelagicum]|uniref:Acyl-CoA dehydrogenase n=1 Tax=Halosimplex pelagicum TaxID=869886 RepID=A0A7D5PB75_9EURY|nr:acyl-CoA dehydrogenase [Halosimplex pelagicum]QLH82062.1 acyl-CoA dehydrogenase [Halosimplex pelagicum]
MNNFKSGSGNLDFGGDGDESAEEESPDEKTDTHDEQTGSRSPDQAHADQTGRESSSAERSTDEQPPETESAGSTTPSEEYPYFVRRNNVGDERGTRLEIHVRDRVADQEAEFRNELAELLGTSEISKTDAREFALIAAFHHPERVADLMREEGFGTLD